MEAEYIISLVTIAVTIILGIIEKKYTKLSNKLIPIQNLLIGVIVAIIEWILTKDFKASIAISGLIAGGSYDIVHNLQKLLKEE